eukprot:TRINITY_DN1094_c0_g2_i1.p1 TRINITY_DN1094_c0_g2~~TRINITY_DN1094_c0_g2_i1.p1  ORF type:complete len:235 (+),score=48.67 TRINITY_DN1094_c0_g2_i1:87-791(+)
MKITGAQHPGHSLAILVLCLGLCAASESDIAVNYLKKFGYISKGKPRTGDTPYHSPGNPGDTPQRPRNGSVSSVTEAVKNFQEFAGLTATGELDDETLTLMNLPRCGVEDFPPTSTGNSSKYQTQGSRWEKTTLSYRVTRYSKKMSGALVNADVRRAFGFWSAATNLKSFLKSGEMLISKLVSSPLIMEMEMHLMVLVELLPMPTFPDMVEMFTWMTVKLGLKTQDKAPTFCRH